MEEIKIESHFYKGFYDGQVYENVNELYLTKIDEFTSLSNKNREWLNENGFILNVNDNEEDSRNGDYVYFAKGTKFVKLTDAVLDCGDCWTRFQMVVNPEVKILIADFLATPWEVFGVEEPDDRFEYNESKKYKFANYNDDEFIF